MIEHFYLYPFVVLAHLMYFFTFVSSTWIIAAHLASFSVEVNNYKTFGYIFFKKKLRFFLFSILQQSLETVQFDIIVT